MSLFLKAVVITIVIFAILMYMDLKAAKKIWNSHEPKEFKKYHGVFHVTILIKK